jgi:MFS family permease
VRANLRNNYVAHFSHGMLGMTGFRIVSAPTFIPTYLFLLTGSNALVGLGQGLQQLGAVLSPIFSAANIEHRKRVLPVAVRIGLAMRLQLLGLALAGWFLTGTPLLLATFLFLFLLGFFMGQQRVAFQMLLSKVIPIERRGRLQAYRNFAGGGVAAILSYFAGAWFIEENILGNGYATTFLLSFILTSIGLVILFRYMREPETPTTRPRMAVRDRLKDLPLLLGDLDYRHFLVAQILAYSARISLPFCILYAADLMELDGLAIGLLTVAFLGADTVANLFWGHAGDRFGYRITFLLSLCLWGAALLLLIFANGPLPVYLAFVGLGASMSGHMMSAQTMVLEFGTRDDLPMRLAFSTTAEMAVSTIAPIAGGLIAAWAGYLPLFWISLGFLCAALAILMLFVAEPRNRRAGA